jgi:hypothetical protein
MLKMQWLIARMHLPSLGLRRFSVAKEGSHLESGFLCVIELTGCTNEIKRLRPLRRKIATLVRFPNTNIFAGGGGSSLDEATPARRCPSARPSAPDGTKESSFHHSLCNRRTPATDSCHQDRRDAVDGVGSEEWTNSLLNEGIQG